MSSVGIPSGTFTAQLHPCKLATFIQEHRQMPLPPFRHPAWLMVTLIACLGAALTSWMGGSTTLPITFVVLAAVFAMILAGRLKRRP